MLFELLINDRGILILSLNIVVLQVEYGQALMDELPKINVTKS
jgi:hypothetical protein